MSIDIMLRECNKIKSEDIRLFTEMAINNLPDYFFTCAASSSGRYHPSYALGDGGLVRHTIAAARIASHILAIEQSQNQFTEREQDYIISALLLHDGWKHGNGNSSHTVFEHPQVCADWINNCEVFDGILSADDRQIISSGIASHMGEWNSQKRSRIVLEKPNNRIQKMVHLCDYLASRKDIEILFEEHENQVESVSLDDYLMPLGKYKGTKITDVAQKDIGYLKWMKENIRFQQPLFGFIDQLITT